jgi:hypothetical protein
MSFGIREVGKEHSSKIRPLPLFSWWEAGKQSLVLVWP